MNIKDSKKRVYKTAAIGVVVALVVVEILDWITRLVLGA